MDKRSFLKVLGAGTLTGFASAQEKLTNWAGNLAYSTNRLHEAKSLADIRAVLKAQERVKVLWVSEPTNARDRECR